MKRAMATTGRRDERGGRDGNEKRMRRTSSDSIRAQDHGLAFAAKNRRQRFFILNKLNSFGGIDYAHNVG